MVVVTMVASHDAQYYLLLSLMFAHKRGALAVDNHIKVCSVCFHCYLMYICEE